MAYFNARDMGREEAEQMIADEEIEARDELYAEMVAYITKGLPSGLAKGVCNEVWMKRPQCKPGLECLHCEAVNILDKIKAAEKGGGDELGAI